MGVSWTIWPASALPTHTGQASDRPSDHPPSARGHLLQDWACPEDAPLGSEEGLGAHPVGFTAPLGAVLLQRLRVTSGIDSGCPVEGARAATTEATRVPGDWGESRAHTRVGWQGIVSEWSSALHFSCTYFYCYYIVSTSDHQALDPGGWDPCVSRLLSLLLMFVWPHEEYLRFE